MNKRRALEGLSAERPEERAAAFAGLSLEIDDDGVAVLEFDQPGLSHNRFTPELLERLGTLIAEIGVEVAEGRVVGVVLASAKPDSFIVGVDVAAIASVDSVSEGSAAARQGQEIFQQLADLSVPTVAAINGTCLGGATEMALACTWRLAADAEAVEIGLPEVNLGIFPGFGGSQRLPRTISLERALPMILAGRSLDPGRAERYGLVDAVVPTPLLRREAQRWARGEGIGQPPQPPRHAPEDRPVGRRLRRFLLEGQPLGRALVFRRAAADVRRRTKGHYPAPERALETIRRGLRLPLPRALQLEAEAVGELVVHDVTANLLGIFFQRQEARSRAREGTAGPPPKVARLGVLGAGVMGGGIAQVAAYNGVDVRMKDIDAGALREGMKIAHRRFEERRRRKRLSSRWVERRMERIRPTTTTSGFRHADLIVEAVVERLDVKHEVLAEIEAAAGPDTVLATNTSSLTVADLAEPLARPHRFVGLHFFNPVHKMQLVEVVRGPASDDKSIDLAAGFARDLGKVPVVVSDAPGFFVNRVLTPYLNEASVLFSAGVETAAIDRALEEFGMPMGPLRLLDEVGLDVAGHVAQQLDGVVGDRIPASDLSVRMSEDGRLGRKSGRGFYRYGGSGKPTPDPEARSYADGSAPGARLAADEIRDRCLLVMLNEAAMTLEEGIVDNPMVGDLALVLGTGFAPFRGGLFRWAEQRGLDRVIARMEELAGRLGDRFEPARALRAAAEGGGFYPESWPEPATQTSL